MNNLTLHVMTKHKIVSTTLFTQPYGWRGSRYADGQLKSKLRGVSHEIAVLCVPVYAYILLKECRSTLSFIASFVFLSCMFMCYGVSSQYHRRKWSLRSESIIRRLDHSAILFMTAGSYTPISMLLLDKSSGIVLLTVAWIGCAIGTVYCFTKTLTQQTSLFQNVFYVIVGLSMVPFSWQVYSRLSFSYFICMPLAWFQYCIGLFVYSSNWPDPLPDVFGYHEVFHLFILGAGIATCIINLEIVKKFG